MRALLVASALAFASVGCVAPAAEIGDEPAAEAPFVPLHLEGELWVTPSSGSELSRHEIPFPVNASGRHVAVAIALGERYGPVDLPTTSAYYEFQIVDAEGEVLAEARREPGGAMEVRLEAADVPMGEATLVALVGGGSDGRANGHHLAYAIDVA